MRSCVLTTYRSIAFWANAPNGVEARIVDAVLTGWYSVVSAADAGLFLESLVTLAGESYLVKTIKSACIHGIAPREHSPACVFLPY